VSVINTGLRVIEEEKSTLASMPEYPDGLEQSE